MFQGMVLYYNEFEAKDNKNKTKNKHEPQHMQCTLPQTEMPLKENSKALSHSMLN